MSSAPLSPEATQARYEILLEVSESIASHRELATLVADLSRALSRIVAFDFIGLTLFDPKERVFRLHVLETDTPLQGVVPEPLAYEQSPTGFALKTRRPLYVPDVERETRYQPILELLHSNSMESFCLLP